MSPLRDTSINVLLANKLNSMTQDELMAVWLETCSGKMYHPLFPQPEEVDMADVAVHLSRINRYLGATKRPYSVAEHCVRLVQAYTRDCQSALRLTGEEHFSAYNALLLLTHDAHEAYLGDEIRPVKHAIRLLSPEAREVRKLMVELCRNALAHRYPFDNTVTGGELNEKKFWLTDYQNALVKHYDMSILRTEGEYLMPSGGKTWTDPEVACRVLLHGAFGFTPSRKFGDEARPVIDEENYDWAGAYFDTFQDLSMAIGMYDAMKESK